MTGPLTTWLGDKSQDNLIMYNFHPYMGPNQAGAKEKNADGFEI